MTAPVVSVIVPTFNEAMDLPAAIDAIARQDHPTDRLEVVVVDGASPDGTAEVARRALATLGLDNSAVVVNERRTTSSNLNLGLAWTTGEIVCRVDARTRIEPHYLRTCAEVLGARTDVSVVGGAQVATPRDTTIKARGIARALNNRWSMGGSRYRRATTSGPSDTVYLGAFRRSDLLAVGGWDEDLISNQDFDLNRRMAARGQVWFDASLRSTYVPRETFRQLWHQYVRFGRAKVRYWRHAGDRPQRRQMVLIGGPPVAAVLALGVLLAAPASLGGGFVLLLGAAALAVEARGSAGPTAGIRGRVVSVAAMAVVVVGWWSGVVREAVSPTRERAGSDLRAPAS